MQVTMLFVGPSSYPVTMPFAQRGADPSGQGRFACSASADRSRVRGDCRCDARMLGPFLGRVKTFGGSNRGGGFEPPDLRVMSPTLDPVRPPIGDVEW